MTTEHKVIGGIIILTLVIIFGSVWFSSKQAVENKDRLSKPMMGEKMADEGAQHVKEGESHEPYNSNPPTSGPHWADVAGPGI